jgi:hypothetical protein
MSMTCWATQGRGLHLSMSMLFRKVFLSRQIFFISVTVYKLTSSRYPISNENYSFSYQWNLLQYLELILAATVKAEI